MLAAGTRSILAPEAVVVGPVPVALAPLPVPKATTPAAAPILLWEPPMAAAPAVLHSAAGSAPAAAYVPVWIDDFLNHAGKSEQERNPNASMRISLPSVAMKPAAGLKPVLGAFPPQGGRS